MKCIWLLLIAATLGAAQNKNERLEWFRDQGFGLFIHWSVDSQLGVVISHSLVGASEDYTTRFFTELPRTFNPRKFDPRGLGGPGEARRREVRGLHHQAPLRLRHVGHRDDRLRHHATPLSARHFAEVLTRSVSRASRPASTSRPTISTGCTRTRSSSIARPERPAATIPV